MSSPKLIEGKYVIVAVAVLGLAGAGGGWWYHQSLQRRPLRLWGAEAARLFLQAPKVELWRLERLPPKTDQLKETPSDLLTAAGEAFRPLQRVDVSHTPGFVHLRHGLVNDYSFDWSEAAEGPREWGYALRFSDDKRSATLLISADFRYALLAETGAAASIRPIAAGVEELLREQLP